MEKALGDGKGKPERLAVWRPRMFYEDVNRVMQTFVLSPKKLSAKRVQCYGEFPRELS